jgi:hypothetical protein
VVGNYLPRWAAKCFSRCAPTHIECHGA